MQATLLELADLQCVYDDIELPCTVCFEKGLRCTAADKIWGQKRELRRIGNQRSETSDRWPNSEAIYVSDDDEIIEIIPRQFPTPDEEMLTPVEAMYIQYFHKSDRQLLPTCLPAAQFPYCPSFPSKSVIKSSTIRCHASFASRFRRLKAKFGRRQIQGLGISSSLLPSHSRGGQKSCLCRYPERVLLDVYLRNPRKPALG